MPEEVYYNNTTINKEALEALLSERVFSFYSGNRKLILNNILNYFRQTKRINKDD